MRAALVLISLSAGTRARAGDDDQVLQAPDAGAPRPSPAWAPRPLHVRDVFVVAAAAQIVGPNGCGKTVRAGAEELWFLRSL